MRIGLVSDIDETIQCDVAARDGVAAVALFVRLLRQQGFWIQWITANDTARALSHEADLTAVDAASMPPTCQYVLPYELYRFEGADLVCLPRSFWQDRALHTRLFTFIGLMQRERPCALWQTWATLATTYLTAYTAAFLDLPCAVYYTAACLSEAPQQGFLWQWVTEHARAGLVGVSSDRDHLLATAALAPESVQVIDPRVTTTGERIAALYQTLTWGG